MRRNPLQNITTSGGLLTADFLLSLREETFTNPLIRPKTFSLPQKPIFSQDELDHLTLTAWERLKERWDDLSLQLRTMDVSEARKKWILPLLRELGFHKLVYSGKHYQFEDGSLKIYISHQGGWEDDVPLIHTVAPTHDLDEHRSTDRNARSPHDSLQLCLNLRKTGLRWAILTNGVLLRVLREFYHTYTRGYVEFDLENIFYEGSFTDFRALFRLVHASRFHQIDGVIPLEQFYNESVAAGARISEDLRHNVKNAIELLGNGLLPREWRQKLAEEPTQVNQFYRELLMIIYRILFLIFSEQRSMLPMHDSLYAEEYSLARLRERAEERILTDPHYDLWYGLRVTFDLIREGCDELKIFGYDGELFDDSQLEMISLLKCRNDVLLQAIRYLTCYEKGRVLQRINFLDIGVEEIGSIYESLLDFTPRVLETAEGIENTDYPTDYFILDPRGVERKSTGSYYTDKWLTNNLIDSTLKPVLENTLNIVDSNQKEKAILNLKICDPACGSGAFLIAANNFLAKKLAQIRTGEMYPSEKEERIARRDILSHCIYGVDINPMAIELAKVSLWINAAVKDLPLNFLDHHLKSGNSLVGATSKQIKQGIPTIAFKAVKGDDKKVSEMLKTINTEQKKLKNNILDKFLFKTEKTVNLNEFDKLNNFSENSKEDVIKKRSKYLELIKDDAFKHQKLIYDTWTSAFFWPINHEYKEAPTEGIFQLIVSGSLNAVKQPLIDNINTISSNNSFFNWELEFPDIFNDNKGFSCILTNPPWGADITQKEKSFFSYVYETSKKNMNSFDLFIRNNCHILRENGYIGMVIPKNSTKSNDYIELREFILKNFQIIDVTFEGLFEGVTQEFVLLTAKKSANIEENRSTVLTINKSVKVPQNAYWNNSRIFYSSYDPLTVKIKEKILKGKQELGDLINIARGEEISKSGKIVQCPKCESWSIYSRKKSLKCSCGKTFNPQNAKEEFLIALEHSSTHKSSILTGEDFEDFRILKTHFFDTEKPGINYKSPEIYKSPKLVMKKICRTLSVAFDPNNNYLTQNVYSIQNKTKNLDFLYYILALLNSKLFKFFYEFEYNLGASYTTAVSMKNVRSFHTKTYDPNSSLTTRIVDSSKKITVNYDKSLLEEINSLIFELYEIEQGELEHINSKLTEANIND